MKKNEELLEGSNFRVYKSVKEVLDKFFTTYNPRQQTPKKEDGSYVQPYTGEVALKELEEMRNYVKNKNIMDPRFVDKIFEFSNKLIQIEQSEYDNFIEDDKKILVQEIELKNKFYNILSNKNHLVLQDLMVFSFLYKDNFKSNLKFGNVLLAAFIFEVIEIELDKIVWIFESKEQEPSSFEFQINILYLRFLFSQILILISDNYSHVN